MTLKLVALKCLLVFQLLFCVLIALKDFIVLNLSKLQTLIHFAFKLLTKCVHLDLLFLHKFSFSCENLFVTVFHVNLTLFLLHHVGTFLDLMSLLIALLLAQVSLNFSQIEKLS